MRIKSLFAMAGLSLAALTCASTGIADDYAASRKPAPSEAKPSAKTTSSGTITAVNSRERTMTVKIGLLSKTFNLADDCTITVEDKHDAGMTDLRASHPVEISYENVRGVLVAHRIAQKNDSFAGTVTAIDRDQHLVTAGNFWSKKNFKITPDSKLSFRDNQGGSLEDLKVGHKVRVTYETDARVAKVIRLDQRSLNFDGVINAVDATDRTLKARVLLSEKKFNLARDCVIVIDGRLGAKLSELKLGQHADIDYEDVNGVNVAIRVAQTSAPADAGKTAATSPVTGTP